MTHDPYALREAWLALRARPGHRTALDQARALGVTEAKMLGSACGVAGSIAATRLDDRFVDLLTALPRLGPVKTVTRNEHAVLEIEGPYPPFENFGHAAQTVGKIDLRIFPGRIRRAFAVRDETARGVSRSLQLFDAAGAAVHKLFLRLASDRTAFDALVESHRAVDQTPTEKVEPPAAPAPPRPDAAIDVAGLRAAWRGLQDTHEFFGLLRKFQVDRAQALRLVGGELAEPLPPSAVRATLERAASARETIMIFVGNGTFLQIHEGPIARVVAHGDWVNVVDPEVSAHLHETAIVRAWRVRKPTARGVVTSIEGYDAGGEQIVHLVGARGEDDGERPSWRALADAIV